MKIVSTKPNRKNSRTRILQDLLAGNQFNGTFVLSDDAITLPDDDLITLVYLIKSFDAFFLFQDVYDTVELDGCVNINRSLRLRLAEKTKENYFVHKPVLEVQFANRVRFTGSCIHRMLFCSPEKTPKTSPAFHLLVKHSN